MRVLLGCAGAVLVCAGTALADLTDLIVGRSAAGRLIIHPNGPQPVHVDPSVFPGYQGWADALPGFESTILNDPANDYYILAPEAYLQWILVSIGPGMQVLNETGSGLMHPGETFTLGNPAFDVHPFWNLTIGPVGATATVQLVVRDQSGLYSDSEVLELTFTANPCYANCDASITAPILNANDFQCFLNKFAADDIYANCDGSTGVPLLTANDFQCFLNSYATGCP